MWKYKSLPRWYIFGQKRHFLRVITTMRENRIIHLLNTRNVSASVKSMKGEIAAEGCVIHLYCWSNRQVGFTDQVSGFRYWFKLVTVYCPKLHIFTSIKLINLNQTIDRLLQSKEPSIRWKTRVNVLGIS